MKPLRLTFFTVMPSPYQREFFAAIAADPGFELRVLYYTAEAHDRHWNHDDLQPFEKVMPGRTFTWLGPSAHWNPDASRELIERRVDVVVVSDYSSLTAQWVMRWLRRQRRPWIFWGEVPGMRKRGFAGRAVRRCLQRPIASGADGVAAIGSRAVVAYEQLTGGSRPVANIPYHCDTSRFAEAAAPRTFDGPEVRILFSGQLIERKGVDTLIRAFAQVAGRHHSARLTLVGAGPEAREYAQLVPDEIASRVDFAGFRQPGELPELFAGADLFVLPSRHDGWGVVVNEAVAAGLPVVVTSGVAAADDLVQEGVNGFVVPVDDETALADALHKLVSSAALRRSFSRAARRVAAEWTLEKGVERWRALCEAVVTASTRAGAGPRPRPR